MGQVFGTIGFNNLQSWIDNQSLFCDIDTLEQTVNGEIKQTKTVKTIYYSCFVCRSVWVIPHHSYLVIAGMMATHRRECAKIGNIYLEDSEIFRMARMKFYFLIKKCKRNGITVEYSKDSKTEALQEKQSKQSRFFNTPWDVDEAKIFFEELEPDKIDGGGGIGG